jgi:hypothetical protein
MMVQMKIKIPIHNQIRLRIQIHTQTEITIYLCGNIRRSYIYSTYIDKVGMKGTEPEKISSKNMLSIYVNYDFPRFDAAQ